MNSTRTWLPALALLLPLLASCGKKSDDEKDEDATTPYSGLPDEDPNSEPVVTETGASINSNVLAKMVTHFKFTSAMDSEIINFLRYDFGTLASWTDTSRTSAIAKLGKLYGLTEVNAGTVSQWLMDRITYIYPDDGKPFKFAFVVPAEKRIYNFSVDTSGGEGVAASNVGGGLYSVYLDQHPLGVDGLLVNYNDSYIPFLAPRTGVMQIGPNFFDDTDSLDTSDESRRGFRTIKSIYRVSVLFHEARHSDGNTAAGTLSFAHPECPSDGTVAEEYEGLPACDDKANGAYNIGSQILSGLAGICDGVCSMRETSILESIQLDVLSRLLVDDVEANYGDPSPEPFLTPIDTRDYQIVPEQ